MIDLIKQKLTYRLVLPSLLLITVLVWLAVLVFPSNNPKVIFCNVGQGDAILITQGFKQMLIDGGPDTSVLACLSKYVPFFDNKIEIIALTHPESDHFGGLISVLEKYKTEYFISSGVGNWDNPGYDVLIQNVKLKRQNQKLIFKNVYTGDKITFGDLQLNVLWPEKEWVEERTIVEDRSENIVEGTDLKVETLFPLNSFGLVFLVSPLKPKAYTLNTFLLLADADSLVQDKILEANPGLTQVDVLKFPHHGSKSGMAEAFMQEVKPKEAVISVGKNTFGHPSKEAIELLEKYRIRVRRTDQEGNIVYG